MRVPVLVLLIAVDKDRFPFQQILGPLQVVGVGIAVKKGLELVQGLRTDQGPVMELELVDIDNLGDMGPLGVSGGQGHEQPRTTR